MISSRVGDTLERFLIGRGGPLVGLIIGSVSAAGCVGIAQRPSSTSGLAADPLAVIQSFESGLSAIEPPGNGVVLGLRRDPAVSDHPLLDVRYPARTSDPAARDVWCRVEERAWPLRGAISFQIMPDKDMPLSVSFLDGNGVAHTHRHIPGSR